MTDQDKILLMSYLDNELGDNEISQVEALISTDTDAQDYLNQLKMTNNEVDAFFSSEDMKLLDLSTSKFVASLNLKPVTSNTNFGEVLIGFFAPKQVLSYSFTAALFLAVGLFLGSSIHDTAQVTGASLIYDQQYTNENVIKISTVTKLIRNTAMIIVIPFLAIKQNKIWSSENNLSSILELFPLFIFGFIIFIFFRSVGDFLFIQSQHSFYYFSESQWNSTVLFQILPSTLHLCKSSAMGQKAKGSKKIIESLAGSTLLLML